MAAGASSHRGLGQTKPTSFSSFPGGNCSLVADKSKNGLRGSTPDSEALMSSDDEIDLAQPLPHLLSNPSSRQTRRQQHPNVTTSPGPPGPFSPVSPSTTAPSGDQTCWANASTNPIPGRGHSSSASFPWSNNIWHSDTQKGPSRRLTEVVPSPTALPLSGSYGFYKDESLMNSPSRDRTAEPAIPFAIPLQPTPKSYRSQSYSVGQLDPDTSNVPAAKRLPHIGFHRPRMGTTYGALQHWPSRPSVLGDLPHDTQGLAQLREVEDDDDNRTSVHLEMQMPGKPPMELLARENAMLRQVLAERDRDTSHDRNTSSNPVINPAYGQITKLGLSSHQARPHNGGSRVDAVNESDARGKFISNISLGRGLTEHHLKVEKIDSTSYFQESKALEGVKKGHWQSSLGFSGITELPRSRRHSFADVPTRQNSVGSRNDASVASDTLNLDTDTDQDKEYMLERDNSLVHNVQREDPNCLHTPSHRTFREPNLESDNLQDRSNARHYHPRKRQSMRKLNHAGGPPSHHTYIPNTCDRQPLNGPLLQLPNHMLYIVTFKAQRADVFYVHESTGLLIKKGDVVIVEADRGTDLGTVVTDMIPWAEARSLKDHYIKKHHEWLMMFSQHGQNGTIAGQNPNGGPQSGVLSSVPSGLSGVHDAPGNDLKPKMIKRVAQNHEIQALREKEGAEAKAKRACHQKVSEHRLNMEILDAEFQMDWKKLTFFYFADSYINFNPLVTDLFKIYKTRIWMSAINTAAIGASLGVSHLLPAVADNHRYSPRLDQVSRHRLVPHADLLDVTSSLAPIQASDQTWSPHPRILEMRRNMIYSNMNGSTYHGTINDLQPPDHFSITQYPQSTISTSFTTANFSTSPSVIAQSEGQNSSNEVPQNPDRFWHQAFQGLSLR